MTAIFRLTLRSGPDAGKKFDLEKNEIIIGRDLKSDVIIDNSEISRKHAKMYLSAGDYFIEDLESTNGTSVKGRVISKSVKLQKGDLIKLGENVILEYQKEIIDETPSSGANDESADKISTSEEEVGSDIISEHPDESLEKIESKPTWLILLIITLGFLIIFCLVPFLLIEFTNQWCNLFSGFFNAIIPGVCP